jgi:MerR family transcriptional regulator/heat shock protein HspR
MPEEQIPDNEPCYVISIAAKLVSLHPQTLRYYDRIGLLQPSRTTGRIRLYSPSDIDRLRKIARLTDELGVNLAGVDVILNMSDRIERLQRELALLRREAESEIRALRQRIRELERPAGAGEAQVINVSAREIKDSAQEDAS